MSRLVRFLFLLFVKNLERGSITDIPRQAMAKKLNNEHLQFIDDSLKENDELTARQLRALLYIHWPDLNASLKYN